MEFQPGDQTNGISDPGGWSGGPSIENASGESRSSGGLGSETLMLASTPVRPLARCGERGTFAPAIRNLAEGAASRAGARGGQAGTIAASTPAKPSPG